MPSMTPTVGRLFIGQTSLRTSIVIEATSALFAGNAGPAISEASSAVVSAPSAG
jgi:hypothetical protein